MYILSWEFHHHWALTNRLDIMPSALDRTFCESYFETRLTAKLKVFFVQNILPLTKFYEQNLYFSFAVMIALFICCARGNLKFLSTFSRYNIICAILLDIICNMVGPIYLYLPTGIKEGTLAIICINSMFLGVMLAIFYSILLISFGRLPAIPVLTQAAKLQMQRAQS